MVADAERITGPRRTDEEEGPFAFEVGAVLERVVGLGLDCVIERDHALRDVDQTDVAVLEAFEPMQGGDVDGVVFA